MSFPQTWGVLRTFNNASMTDRFQGTTSNTPLAFVMSKTSEETYWIVPPALMKRYREAEANETKAQERITELEQKLQAINILTRDKK